MEKKILKKICPYCGKEIISIYKSQLEYNFKAHILSCKNRKDKGGKEDDKN